MNRSVSNSAVRRGFTLVELLVVVAIIAVLIAILLPALSRARQASNKVVCSSNMRQIALATANYAAAFKGFLPTYIGFNPSNPSAGGFSVSNAYHKDNVKLLVDSKMLVNDKVRYCPTGPQGELFGGRANYEINPHPGVIAAGVVAGGGYSDALTKPRWLKLQEIPKDRALLVDVIYGPNEVSHADKKGGSSWNVCFPDGHVVNAVAPAIANTLPSRPGNTWGRLNDYVRYLELTATNRDPNLGKGSPQWNQYYPPIAGGDPALNIPAPVGSSTAGQP